MSSELRHAIDELIAEWEDGLCGETDKPESDAIAYFATATFGTGVSAAVCAEARAIHNGR